MYEVRIIRLVIIIIFVYTPRRVVIYIANNIRTNAWKGESNNTMKLDKAAKN